MRRLFIVWGMALASCSPGTSPSLGRPKQLAIINGSLVKAEDLISSSVVGIYNFKKNSICTGTLISSNIVLTAAHCVPDRAGHVKIVFSVDIDDTINTREQDILQEYVLSAVDFKVSPIWDPRNETREMDTGDIALIKFKGSAPAGFMPVNFLTTPGDLKIGSPVIVAGFGVNTLKKTKIHPQDYDNLEEAIQNGDVFCDTGDNAAADCFTIETDGDGILRRTEAPISAIDATEVRLDERRSGTCTGDSGGPAFVQKNGNLYLFGVTSRGSALCNDIGVYTNALSYMTWIAQTMESLSKK